MEEKTCPVCGVKQNEESKNCPTCGWDFPMILGSREEDISDAALSLLDEARKKWAEKWVNRDEAPDFKRDPFEYEEDRVARLESAVWKVGRAVLVKDAYEIQTGRFPMAWKEVADWAVEIVEEFYPVLNLGRDAALSLYASAEDFPMGLRLGVKGEKVRPVSCHLWTGAGVLEALLEKVSVSLGNGEERRDEKILENHLGMRFVKIHSGGFWMGSPENEPKRSDSEKRHRVRISKDFYLMTTPVTQGQWEAVMGYNPSHFKDCGRDCPVESVSWNEVQEFIKKLNDLDKTLTLRLPTEAEWEYACRAGTETPFAFGECLSTDDANYDGRYPLPGCSSGICRKMPVKVASFKPNAWGLYDMHGNISEWVQDVYREDYENLSGTDPIHAPGTGGDRVFRDGGWYGDARFCRSANREKSRVDKSDIFLGFRLAGS